MEGTCGPGTEPRHNFGGCVIVTSELFNKGDLGVETGTGRCFPWWDWDRNEVRLLKPLARTFKDFFYIQPYLHLFTLLQ
jgi:hypothetical protein